MNKRIIWTLVSLLMAVTLIIASCDTKTEEKTVEEDDEGKVVITETEVHLDEEKVEEEEEMVFYTEKRTNCLSSS